MTPIVVEGIVTQIKYNKLYIHCDNTVLKNKYKSEQKVNFDFKIPVTYTGLYVKLPKDITTIDISPLRELKNIINKKIKVRLKPRKYKFRNRDTNELIEGITLSIVSLIVIS